MWMNIRKAAAFGIATVILGIFSLLAAGMQKSAKGQIQPPAPPPEPAIVQKNWDALLAHTVGSPRGNPKAAWSIIECSDFECPACCKAMPELIKLVDRSGGEVNLYFLSYPIKWHKQSEGDAEAGLAANAQGKFWPMYEMLYREHGAFSESEIEKDAVSIPGLDLTRLSTDLESKKYATQVADGESVAAACGIQSAPTYLVRASSGGLVYVYTGQKRFAGSGLALGDLVQNPPWKAATGLSPAP
jgi:protein-disulfide isomerase